MPICWKAVESMKQGFIEREIYMKTNLIIVEGLPGSGKSTTAAMIADELNKKGKKVICVDEGVGEHPADYADYDFPDFETEKITSFLENYVE